MKCPFGDSSNIMDVPVAFEIRAEAGAFQPVVKAVNVVARWFSLPKHEDVNEAERQRHAAKISEVKMLISMR